MDNKLGLITAVTTAVYLSACASGSPPTQQLHLSESTISQAIDSGARTAAPEELQSAQDNLSEAKHLISRKKYKDAKRLLKVATTDAKLALITTEASHARKKASKFEAQSTALKMALSSQEQALANKQSEIAALQELQAKQTDRGMVLTLGDVLFDTNKSTMNSGAMAKMDRIAAFMQAYPDRQVKIEGHTDNTGEDDYNQMLSLQRANAVMAALTDRGIGAGRISTHGLGEAQPVASNDSASSRQLNRRVEMVFPDTVDAISTLDY